MEIRAKLSQKHEGRRLVIELSEDAILELQNEGEIVIHSGSEEDFDDSLWDREENGQVLGISSIHISKSKE